MRSCDRCLEPTEAASRTSIAYNGTSYVLWLCERHADMLQTDMFGWTRLGEIQEEPVRQREDSPRRVVASYVAPPPLSALPLPDPEGETSLTGRWRLSAHALQRCGTRQITP